MSWSILITQLRSTNTHAHYTSSSLPISMYVFTITCQNSCQCGSGVDGTRKCQVPNKTLMHFFLKITNVLIAFSSLAPDLDNFFKLWKHQTIFSDSFLRIFFNKIATCYQYFGALLLNPLRFNWGITLKCHIDARNTLWWQISTNTFNNIEIWIFSLLL